MVKFQILHKLNIMENYCLSNAEQQAVIDVAKKVGIKEHNIPN